MRKIILFLIIVLISTNSVYAFGNKIDKSAFDGRGYVGTLPDLTSKYKSDEPDRAKPEFETTKNFNSENEIKPVPRDNPSFINIIVQPNKVSEYVNDMNEVINMFEAVLTSIENQENVQKFVAKTYFLDKNIEYLEEKYNGKPESQYISFKKITEANTQCKSVASLRSEAEKYKSYMAYSGEGAVYNENNIREQLDYLKSEIEDTISVLKEVN